jgi:hypothetical protein
MRTANEERAFDRAMAARLVGRTIVRAVPHAGWDTDRKTNRSWIHNWVFHLDDGSTVRFVTEETDHGSEYGTDIIVEGP